MLAIKFTLFWWLVAVLILTATMLFERMEQK